MTLRQVLLTGLEDVVHFDKTFDRYEQQPGESNLTDARDGRAPLVQAIHDYEAEMIEYGFEAVLDSRKQMDDRTLSHKPVVGRVALAAVRTGLRLVNVVPPLKRRMADAQQRTRGAARQRESPPHHRQPAAVRD
jgi:hypothetical protein